METLVFIQQNLPVIYDRTIEHISIVGVAVLMAILTGVPIGILITQSARGRWTFQPVAGGTKVVWSYTFVATNGLAGLPLSSVAQLLWRRYMDVCLENSRVLLANQNRNTP